MAERTPVVKKYRDALETVIGSTMDFLAHVPPSNSNQDPTLSSPIQLRNSMARAPQQSHRDLPGPLDAFSPAFSSAAQESYVRGSPRNGNTPNMGGDQEYGQGADGGDLKLLNGGENDVFAYMPETHASPGAVGRWEGRHGEMGQMDGEWLLSLCEGDGFNLQMLNEMMRFEPSLGA